MPRTTVQSPSYHLCLYKFYIHILYKFHSAFRKNHSTDFCLSYLTDKISKGFDSGLLTGVISGLQKAFDTIDHNILLLKIPLIGFSLEVID